MAMKLSMTGLHGFVEPNELKNIKPLVEKAQEILENGGGAGNDFLGWVKLPKEYDKEEYARIKQAAQRVQKNSQVFVIIGIGGSYLGSRAGIEFCRGVLYNATRREGIPEIYYVGNNISSSYLYDVIGLIGDRDFSVNIISKSGTTTEPAIAFRVFRQMLEKKYGKEGARERIFATTDRARGALKKLADTEGYESFVIPDDVGGRYSVLTAVGLFPMAVADIDIDEVMHGAGTAYDDFLAENNKTDKMNDCATYAAVRNLLYRKDKSIEILANYEPALMQFGEWFKQLFAESEGKGHAGIYPTTAHFSTDLHSVGQFIQDGTRNMFETVLWVKTPRQECHIVEDPDNIDGLNYLTGETVQFVNRQAFLGTVLAHMDGGTPNVLIELCKSDAFHFGYMVYFFEKACGISGYLLGVNPFDQPGVEAYKKNMFALLGKPGFEDRRKMLEMRLGSIGEDN